MGDRSHLSFLIFRKPLSHLFDRGGGIASIFAGKSDSPVVFLSGADAMQIEDVRANAFAMPFSSPSFPVGPYLTVPSTANT